jgi:hypothetical protein
MLREVGGSVQLPISYDVPRYLVGLEGKTLSTVLDALDSAGPVP